MSAENNLEVLKYFLESYFNESANYEELEELVHDFNEEDIEYRIRLSKELKDILKYQKEDFIQEYLRRYGKRKMSKEKIEWFIKIIQTNLEFN
ncbi:hypothetical protein RGU11_02835 [Rossellomorea marisflavi]|uniref:hypothetical protein n=1 Tax=Rossellomorea marisflavi TaxID=189381 RepID=UPI0028531E32|nr:hypothetical protein [Rossellomorea marisflavi]MDR4935316.1 hypothetical protein [Rossellomorea marisflavi]